MEIQGLSGAQVIHSQHGVPHRTVSSPLPSEAGSTCRFISTEDETDVPELSEQRSDSNNNRARTSPFRLLVENGSGAALSNVSKQQPTAKGYFPIERANVELYNVSAEKDGELNVLFGLTDSARAGWKFGESETVMQMAMPLFEGDEEPMQQRQLTLPCPVLRQQQCKDGVYKQLSFAVDGTVNPGSSLIGKDPSDASCLAVDYARGKMSEAYTNGSAEVGNVLITLCDPNKDLNRIKSQALKTHHPVFSLLNEHSTEAPAKQTNVLTNKLKVCDENKDDQRPDEPPLLPRNKENRAGITGSTDMVEVMDTSDFIDGTIGLQDGTSHDTLSTSPPANEPFSGSIMINNQSIIVTIENGILTLAAPPDGSVHKQDDIVCLKEHLGVKDHEDIVLLNYDGGTKSIGKISTLAVTNFNQQEELRPGSSVSDPELALVGDCSLSELATSLDPCPIVKQEAGALCPTLDGDLVTQYPKDSDQVADCDHEGFLSAPLSRSKKETVGSFGCPELDCSFTFDSRQKLKVHLLNHAEDPRPYQCTMEGCGWAFATSYKLKRHLRSHDKQRPHTCQFEGCGRRFTTVYNLKAHVKVHDQEKAFICEICSERFRSATRLTNHQRVHFEPQRPHKCEFTGSSANRCHFKNVFNSSTVSLEKTYLYTYSLYCSVIF